MMDAKYERVFYQQINNQQSVHDTSIKVNSIHEVLKQVKKKTLFIGSGAEIYKDVMKEKIGEKALIASDYDNNLQAEKVARIGLKAFNINPSMFTKDYLLNIKPLYILPPRITKPKNS
jgi:tRNA A37 threonylcarbamoyladenosine modification protein TsaB